MFKPSEAKMSCLSVLKGNNIPFLIGGTGVGKSAIVKEIAEETGWSLSKIKVTANRARKKLRDRLTKWKNELT